MEIDKSIDISSTKIPYTSCRGNAPAVTYRAQNLKHLQYYTSICFSLHSLTHFELPWCIEDSIDEVINKSKQIKIGKLPTHEEMNQVVQNYSMPRSFESVIIDVTDKREEFKKNYLDTQTGLIRPDLDEFQFNDLMKLLKIELNEESKASLKEKFVIFRTGWGEFNPFAIDLNNPFFEARHPYLCNPYLSATTVNSLVREIGVQGIGSDSYGLDNPLCYANPHFLPDYARIYYYNSQKMAETRYVLALLVTERKYYLKNLTDLDNPKLVFNNGFCEGKLVVIPISFGTLDANLARVFFQRKV